MAPRPKRRLSASTAPIRITHERVLKRLTDLAQDHLDERTGKVVQKPAPDPFAPDEVEVVLEVLRRTEGEEMADWFEFAFFAGMRTSEQIALQWTNVDLRTHTAVVKQARVMARDKDRTKTNVERTVELNTPRGSRAGPPARAHAVADAWPRVRHRRQPVQALA
jgi:integrase